MQRLPHLNAIRIEGQDALAFSQSQVTSDLLALGPDQWQPAAWCNAQGQVIVVMLVRVSESGVDWVVPTNQAASTARALSPYTIGRQVRVGAPQPVMGDWSSPQTGKEHPRLAHDPDRVLVVAEAATNSTDDPAGVASWRRADLDAGLAWLCPELSTRFLPQSLGLERLGGLSYKKGCYPGQEVIAKIHYRGQIKQHLVLLSLHGDSPTLSPDHPVYATGDDRDSGANKPCGVIIEQAGDHALAVVRATLSTGDALYTDSANGANGRIQVGEINDLPTVENPTPVS